MNKVQAPSILLEDFNYFFNKAINQYINKRYNIYDVNQQTTDDIRVLKSTAKLFPINTVNNIGIEQIKTEDSMYGALYEFQLPADYLHLLNCVVNYKVKKQFKCYDQGDYWQTGAIRLTADLWPQIINNFYMRPSYKKPYYYIHNVNTSVGKSNNNVSNLNPTNIIVDNSDSNTSIKIKGTDGSLPTSLTLSGGDSDDLIEKTATHRYGNASNVRLELRYGKDNSIFELNNIWVDYIKTPQHIRITQDQLDMTADTSQIMEFPDYVCQEIINELVHILMENSTDQRLQSHPIVTQSIANPTQEQTEQPKK